MMLGNSSPALLHVGCAGFSSSPVAYDGALRYATQLRLGELLACIPPECVVDERLLLCLLSICGGSVKNLEGHQSHQ